MYILYQLSYLSTDSEPVLIEDTIVENVVKSDFELMTEMKAVDERIQNLHQQRKLLSKKLLIKGNVHNYINI